MAFRLRRFGPIKNCEVALTASKSISNRVLVIRALCKEFFGIENLSTSTDTQGLKSILEKHNSVIDVIDAGTSFRFLVSYLSIQEGDFVLTGSSRMKLRPIAPLVETLQSLGASIEYLEENGFPPLKITGKELNGGDVSIDRSFSSQYVSSLLMIAPLLGSTVKLQLKGIASSDSYLNMTLQMMKEFGVEVIQYENTLEIVPQKYSPKNFVVESDWSSASYWYSLCALNPGSEFVICGLKEDSVQGDRIIADVMKDFGVITKFETDKIIISSDEKVVEGNSDFEYDFSSNPDLVMTIAVLCAAKGIRGTFKGVQTLQIKESDRLKVLKSELAKCGVEVEYTADILKVIPHGLIKLPSVLETHNDHRIVMSFAPLASILESISFDNIDVVSKSYPEFWKQLALAGIEIESPII